MEIEFEAAILVGHNEPLEIGNVRFENDLSVGQVLVELIVSGICGSQLGEIDGVKGEDKFIPHLMGHEGCGIIKKIGPGVSTVKEGDKVVLHWKKGSGIKIKESQRYRTGIIGIIKKLFKFLSIYFLHCIPDRKQIIKAP